MPTLGLAMIVKNGAQTLRNCLASVQGIVSTIIIGDTGSTDETVAIAREFGAIVLPMAWIDDFAQARNAVLEHMQTDWILSLDADEAVAEGSAEWIRNAIADPAVDAYHIQIRNYISPHFTAPIDQIMLAPDEIPAYAPDTVAYALSASMRLFRRDPEVYFIGCVHEMVEYRILALGRSFRAAGFFLHHFGWYLRDQKQTKEKRDAYFDLMGKKLKQMPNDTNSLVRYGYMLFDDYGRADEALEYMQRALAINPNSQGAWLWTGLILAKLRRYDEALEALDRVPEHDCPALRIQLVGDCMLGSSRLAEARETYEAALLVAPYDRLVRSKLGLTEVRLGLKREGLDRIRAAAEATPANEFVEQILVSAYIAADQIPEALVAGEAFARRYKRLDAWLEVVQTYAHRGEWQSALQAVHAAIEQLPDALPLQEFRLTAALATGEIEDAAQAARRVAEMAPSAETLLRLATILHHKGDLAEAQRILQLREAEYLPSSAETIVA